MRARHQGPGLDGAFSTRAIRTQQTPAMPIAAEELLEELARVEATLRDAARRQGQGCGPDFERRLQAHQRSLRSMLDADGMALAVDALEAAQRVMASADATAPLLMLDMARKTLRAFVQRQAAAQRVRDAA